MYQKELDQIVRIAKETIKESLLIILELISKGGDISLEEKRIKMAEINSEMIGSEIGSRIVAENIEDSNTRKDKS